MQFLWFRSTAWDVSPLDGQKTGFFLDQRDSRAFISTLSNNKKVLNLFSYSGGFSVAAIKGGASDVVSVDSSKHAIEFCKKNIELNQGTSHRAIDSDVFDYLKESKELFDIVVCDPPAFAKHVSAEKAAIKGYARLNKAALEKVAPDGLFATFSCSQVVSASSFESAVTSACVEVGRPARIIHRFTQACCHPESVFHPEGRYLKGLLLQLDY
jgi:23S rRNA (cytosine1962-C5)-methyltransferase